MGFAGVAVSCTDYEGDIDNLTERVKKLENTVSDLQTAITNGAVITDVTPITNGVKVTLSNKSLSRLPMVKMAMTAMTALLARTVLLLPSVPMATGSLTVRTPDSPQRVTRVTRVTRVILVRTATTAHLALLVRTALTARMPFRSGISLAPTRVTPTTASGLSTPMILPPRRQLLRSRTSMCSLREP